MELYGVGIPNNSGPQRSISPDLPDGHEERGGHTDCDLGRRPETIMIRNTIKRGPMSSDCGCTQKPFVPDPIEASQMDYSYFGLSMQQNRYALPAISILLEYGKPSRIMEFGTRFGGLSVFLGMYAKTCNIECYTFDIADQAKYKDFFNFMGVHYLVCDIFDPAVQQEISGLIRRPGRTILFCDAIKEREFNVYAADLKPGDIILAHDYAKDQDDFEVMKKQRIWWQCEIEYDDIANTCSSHHLVPVFADLFRTAAWCCFVKR